MPAPLVFISYAREDKEDERLCKQLAAHLAVLRRQDRLRIWTLGDIDPGRSAHDEMSKHLSEASLVLLMLSRSYFASDELCELQEMAVARHVPVIPVLLRACDWESSSLGEITPLPTDGIPVASAPSSDEALHKVAKAIGEWVARAQPDVGYLLGFHRLLAKIGHGPLGSVWDAEDTGLGDRVAVRILDDPSQRERFFDAAQAMASVQHPAFVRVRTQPSADQGRPYVVTDLVQGSDLDQTVARKLLRPQDVVPLILGVGDALAEAHSKGYFHRHLSPSSILVDLAGRPRLTALDPRGASASAGGTDVSFFTAPDRAGAPADVYGLGMTAIFCLHGDEAALRRPDKAIEALPCDEGLKRVLTKAIELNAKERYADAGAFCAALRGAIAPPPPPPPQPVVVSISPPEMVRIPGGTFEMGSRPKDTRAHADERPLHPVTLSPYEMARGPVTRELYEAVMHQRAADDLPVTRVSWVDALRFCNRLSEIEGLAPAYREDRRGWVWDRSADGYRLPSEAEWELAARGADGRTYPWGDDPPSNQLCWNGEGSSQGRGRRLGPCPVGSHPAGASPFGLLDMAGNVWEWCWDFYVDHYERAAARDPEGPASGGERVLRGGGWDNTDAVEVRAARRNKASASDRLPTIGFRCARGPR